MARTDLARLKAEVSLLGVARELGLEVEERGGRHWARCPFHGDDAKPSLQLDEAKGLWNCFGCPSGASGGDVIRLVERVRRVGFADAVALLRERGSGAVGSGAGSGAGDRDGGAAPLARIELAEGLAAGASPEERRSHLLGAMDGLYRKSLWCSGAARRYLGRRGLGDGVLCDRFGLGYCDGSLARKVAAEEERRAELQALGVLNARGNESLYQCITVALRDERGAVTSIYGRSITAARHHYLRGPRRGLVNGGAFGRERTVILTEAIFDALTLLRHGFENAVPLYGTQGFTACHRAAIAASASLELVVLAFDNDASGREASAAIGREVAALGKSVLAVELPEASNDVNDFFTAGGTRGGFEALLAEAREVPEARGPRAPTSPARTSPASGNGRPGNGSAPPRPADKEPAASPEKRSPSSSLPPPSAVARDERAAGEPVAPVAPGAIAAPSEPGAIAARDAIAAPDTTGTGRPAELGVFDEQRIAAELGGLRYEIRGRPRGSAALGTLRATILVRGERGSHLDRIDLCQARARRRYAREGAEELVAVQPRAIERDLLRLVEVVSWVLAEEERRAASGGVEARAAMTVEERASAEGLLEAPDLLERAVRDLDALGYVGEERNKKIALLVAVSRLLDKPLAAIFSSASGAGKSRLAELVAELTPPEDVSVFSRITPAALYYMESGIEHKLLVIDEREGSDAADYSIRSLQTRGKLSLAVPVKDPASGKMRTQCFEIEGPVAYMESTTRARLNPENENRCYLLHLDESPEQTARIQAAQRTAIAAGGLGRRRREALIGRWRNAQRLLERLGVLVPFAAQLTFPDKWVRARRDHERLLALISASALLHQRRREVRALDGRRVVVAAVEDYRVAHELTADAVALAQSDASKGALGLLATVWERAEAIAERTGLQAAAVSFTRRELRDWSGRPDTTVRRLLGELCDLEYLVASGRAGQGKLVRYRLNAAAARGEATAAVLLAPEELQRRLAAGRGASGRGAASKGARAAKGARA